MRNWGRWGPDDELGTLNLIDDAARRRGAASVVSGQAFALGLPLSEAEGIQLGFVEGRVNPTRTMIHVNEPRRRRPRVRRVQRGRVLHGHPGRHPLGRAGPLQPRRADLQRVPGVERSRRTAAPPAAASIAPAPWSAGASCSTWPAPSAATCSSPATRSRRRTSTRPATSRASSIEPGDIVLVRTGQMVHLQPERRDLVAYTWPSPGLTIETAAWFHAPRRRRRGHRHLRLRGLPVPVRGRRTCRCTCCTWSRWA